MTGIGLLIEQAKVLRKAGDFAAAARLYEQAAAISAVEGDRKRSMHSLRHAAEIWLHGGDPGKAQKEIQEVLDHYRENPPESLEMANALRVAGLAAEAAGDAAQALLYWTEARGLYAELKIEAGVAEADRRIASFAA